MLCKECQVEKLSVEFPQKSWYTFSQQGNILSENVDVELPCKHPRIYCLECVAESLRNDSKCPGCPNKISNARALADYCSGIINVLYPKCDESNNDVDLELAPSSLPTHGGQLHIKMMNGDPINVMHRDTLTVKELKIQIKSQLNINDYQQRLLYGATELQEASRTMKDYNIPVNSSIHLLVLLYAVPDHLDDVVFDLHWGYPSSGKDFLDATCFMYSGKSFVNYVDYRCASNAYAISHSGDVMDDVQCRGHHTIRVRLKSLPSHVNALFFALSAWSSLSISCYPSPSLTFRDATKPFEDLCNTTFAHAGNKQAIVLCCAVQRESTGRWEIINCGQHSSGNARNYANLMATVDGIIKIWNLGN